VEGMQRLCHLIRLLDKWLSGGSRPLPCASTLISQNFTIVRESILLVRTARTGLSESHRNVTQWIGTLPGCLMPMWNLARTSRCPRFASCYKSTNRRIYRRRQKYGGMKSEMAKQLKAAEKETARCPPYVTVWGKRISERRACRVLGSHATPNDAKPVGRMIDRRYCTRCGYWLVNVLVSHLAVFIGC
jgi:hypothetical protein